MEEIPGTRRVPRLAAHRPASLAVAGALNMVCSAISKFKFKFIETDPPTNYEDLPTSSNTDKRKADYERLSAKYPERIPMIVIAHSDLYISTPKFLTPKDLTWGQFMFVVRKKILSSRTDRPGSGISPEEALYGMVGSYMIPSTQLIKTVAEQYAHTDGMLYVHIYRENTFG